MATLIFVLIAIGTVCLIASFIIPNTEEKQPEITTPAELSDENKARIQEEIQKLIERELSEIEERTEASLDKISNTKILEMSDYAKTVIDQINKDHNEVMFLYDMLNEKSKDVKNTVREVNTAKREVKRTLEMSNIDQEKALGC